MKKVLTTTAIVLAVLLAALLVTPMLFEEKIAQIVKREANGMLNAKLDFEKLNISLLRHFPRASLDLKGLTLIGVERFEGDTIVAARRISVVVNPMSLLGDDGFEVTKVILASPSLHARKLADGAVNWDVMKPAETPAPEEPAPDETPSTFRLSVRDFRIDDATIRYEDDSTGMRFWTTPLALRLRGDLSAAQAELDLNLTAAGMNFVSGGIPMLHDAEAALDAVIEADLENNRFTLSDNRLRLNAIEVALDGWVQTNTDAIAMDLTVGADKVRFKDVLSLIPAFYTRDFKNLTATGELSLGLWARGEMRGAVLPAFELKADVANGSFKYASLPRSVDAINLSARIANPGDVMDKTEIDLSRLALSMAGNDLTASLYATNLVSDLRFRAAADGRVDLGAIKEVYPLDEQMSLNGLLTANVKVAGRMSDVEHSRYEQMSASGTLVVEKMGLTMPNLPEVQVARAAATITPASMTLGELALTVGSSDLSANGQLTGYLGYLLRDDMLSGRLYVKSQLLDLNEILNILPETEQAGTAPAEDETTTVPTEAFVVPRNLNLSLNTSIEKVLFQKMTISDIAGEARVADGAVSLDRLRLGLFDGTGTASGSYSTAVDPQRPALKLALGLQGASFSKSFDELDMVKKIVPVFAKTGGDYSLSLDMNATLDAAMQPDLQSINASGEIKSANIHVQNLEVFDALATALKNDALRKIEARDVAIRFAIKDGRVTTQPFDLKLGNVKLNMSGSTGLDQTIDYTARVALPEGTAGGVLQNVNVGIGGTFTAPKISVDAMQAAKEAIGNVVDQQIQNLTGSESLGEEIQKQAENLRTQAHNAGDKLVTTAEQQRDRLVEEASKKGVLAKLAAQTAGDKLVNEARKQADKLTAEAETQIEKLTAEKTE